jgi:hypothetical protein
LFAGSGSWTPDATSAWLVIVPAAEGRTLISTEASAAAAIVPSAHVTMLADSEQVPCEGVAESKVTPAGSVSISSTVVASEGPAFSAVRL